MRFVDGEQRDLGALQQLEEPRRDEPLGCDVEQVQLARRKLLLGPIRGPRIERGVEHRGRHAGLGEARDLVLHQRDQRRHHDRAAVAHQRRDLIAERFAAAGRHQHERVSAVGDVADDFFLGAAEFGVAEDGGEDREGGGGELRFHGGQDSGRAPEGPRLQAFARAHSHRE